MVRTNLRASGPRPEPFSVTTTRELWTDPHVSAQMLQFHLDPAVDLSSRRPEAIDAAVAWTTATFALDRGASVLDLGCGPGLYTQRWAAAGAEVTGVDFSARSLAYAREVTARDGLQIAYVEADYLAWQPNRTFDLVTLIFCDFAVLGPAERTALAASVASWLAPGGAFVLDVPSPAYLASREEGERTASHPDGGFWSAGPHEERVETIVYPDERVTLDRYTVTEAGETRTIWTWLQAYDPDSLAATLAPAGLVIETVLGDVAGRPYDPAAHEFAVVARRAPAVPFRP